MSYQCSGPLVTQSTMMFIDLGMPGIDIGMSGP